MSRFVFGWDAYEELYGETRDEHRCPSCGSLELPHWHEPCPRRQEDSGE